MYPPQICDIISECSYVLNVTFKESLKKNVTNVGKVQRLEGGFSTEDKKFTTRLKSKVFSLEILILLIWTNAPRTNVAWTNVVVTVVICCICSQDPLLKV